MHSGWQDKFIERYPQIDFYDPRSHGLTDPKAYATWDIDAIGRSYGIIAYLEESNPSGLGMAFEIGYAVGLDLLTIFINEKDDRYAKIIEHSVHHNFSSIEEAFALFDDYFAEKESEK